MANISKIMLIDSASLPKKGDQKQIRKNQRVLGVQLWYFLMR